MHNQSTTYIQVNGTGSPSPATFQHMYCQSAIGGFEAQAQRGRASLLFGSAADTKQDAPGISFLGSELQAAQLRRCQVGRGPRHDSAAGTGAQGLFQRPQAIGARLRSHQQHAR